MRQYNLLLAHEKCFYIKLLMSMIAFCAYQHCLCMPSAHMADLPLDNDSHVTCSVEEPLHLKSYGYSAADGV